MRRGEASQEGSEMHGRVMTGFSVSLARVITERIPNWIALDMTNRANPEAVGRKYLDPRRDKYCERRWDLCSRRNDRLWYSCRLERAPAPY